MTIKELFHRLKELGISENRFYLNGLFGSFDDNEKQALTIRKEKFGVIYEIYYKEKGKKQSIRTYNSEEEACDYLYEKLVYEWLSLKMKKIEDIDGMTVNERLYVSGLIDLFDKYITQDSTIIKQILMLIKVDNQSIDKIIK